MSFVGLISGRGSEGAPITSRMYCGGLLYPDASSTGVADAEVALEEDSFDCADMSPHGIQATNTPAKRQFKGFRTLIVLSASLMKEKLEIKVLLRLANHCSYEASS